MSVVVDLTNAGYKELQEASEQLKRNISALCDEEGTDEITVRTLWKLKDDFDNKEKELQVHEKANVDTYRLAHWFELIRDVSQSLGMLRIAANQRKEPERAQELDEIDNLIRSCYQPVIDALGQNPAERLTFTPDHILAIFFQDQYLARPAGPVPYLIVPNFYENDKPWAWIGVGHEVGHHVYRQVKSLRDEIEIVIADALVKNGASDAQQRLWFNYSEEGVADTLGITTMGGAFVAAQQIILLLAGSALPMERPPDLDRYLEGLLVGQDVTHPIPLVRATMGVHIYKCLLDSHDSPLLADLEQMNESLLSKFAGRPLRDPHTPRNKNLEDKVNPTGELGMDETLGVMTLVVNTLLNQPLTSLRGRTLSELVDFVADEQLREDSLKALDEEKKLPPNATKLDEVASRRYEVAARRLREWQKWRDHRPQ